MDPRIDVRIEVGVLGERAAETTYVARGYRVIARNWRCRIGELDLVVSRGQLVAVCEVKTRRGARHGGGFEAVDVRKRNKVRALAEIFLLQHRTFPAAVRFDVASVWLRPDGSSAVEIFEDAF
jgi:putative endonuclease